MKKTLLLFLLLPFFGFAQVELAKWNAATSTNTKKPVVDASVTSYDLSSPTGITVDYNNSWESEPFFICSGWPTAQQTEAEYDPAKYVEFKVSPNTGKKLDLNAFRLTYRSQGGGTSEKFTILYSKDVNFKTDVKVLVPPTASSNNWTTINPSFSEEINPVLPGQIIYVRLYVYTSNNNFHIKTGVATTSTLINGTVSNFDPNKILAINDYVKTVKNTALNISPLNNDVKKENVTSITISAAPPVSEGTVTINPDKTITFNPANNFTGVTSFKYIIKDASNLSSEAKVQVTIAEETPEGLVTWYGRNSSNRLEPTLLSPYVSSNNITTNNGIGLSYNNGEDVINPFFQASGWPSSSTIDNTKYVEFRVTADNSHRVNLSAFNLVYRAQGTPQKLKITYSTTAGFTNTRTLLVDTPTTNNWTPLSVPFSSDLNSLTPGQTLYIRLYVYDTYNNFHFRTKVNIAGNVKDSNTFAAYSDFATTTSNQNIPISILANDVVGNTPVQSITVTQPTTGGTVTVNGTTNITFTPTAGFVGTSNFTYTIFNGTVYSSATVSVNVTAPPCVVPGNQTSFANGSWIGYVYSFTGNTAPNPAYNALPTGTGVNYLGTVTETTRNFDRDVDTGAVNGATRNFCEAAPTDRFFVRYKMTENITEAGQYNFMLGSDDGIRLYVDGVKVLERWNQHSYIVDSVLRNLTAGTHEFILEYFELDGSSRAQISFGLVKGDQTLPYGDKVWNVYGFVKNDLNLSNVVYAGNFVDPSLNVKSTTYWPVDKSPAAATIWQGAPMPIDNFTVSYRRQNFPCGTYKIELANADDAVQIYLDNTLLFTQSGYTNTAAFINNGATYNLGANSKIEVRLREDGGNANVAVNLVRVLTTYTGSETVNSNSSIVISSTIVTLSSDIKVCSCTINAGSILNVPVDKTLTVDEDINVVNGGKLVILNGGSLLQTTTSKTMFTGNATTALEVQRKISARRLDLTYWSIPITKVGGFTMHDLSPDTLLDKYFYYDTTAGWVSNINGTLPMEVGKGYSIRAPQYFDNNVPAEFTGIFSGGVPNNGDISVDVVQGKFNLVGNPYPSAIKADDLIKGNSGLGTLYFWTHNSLPTQSKPGDTSYYYGNADFAAYNLTGTAGGAKLNGKYFEGYIAVGQGFLAKPASGKINYNNTMRKAGNNSQFYKTNSGELEKNRVWLNISNTEGAYRQLLVGYIEGATNSIDNDYDALTMGSNNYVDFYSINESKKLSIQGRALPFSDADVIPLGYKTTVAGEFTIEIDHADGFFDKQAVYLEDLVTGKTIDLRSENYKFTTEIGTFTTRFNLRYASKTLGTGDFENAENSVLVSVKSKVVKINATKENIKDVKIYNISGQMLYNKTKVDSNELQITNLPSGNQVLLVKVILENDAEVTKKIIFN